MRFSEFRIKNFRSIIDSGWNTLSADNITALIGQNESGKTSVLEALHCFFQGTISEDVLRSDLSMPEISCSFTPEDDLQFGFTENSGLPPGVLDLIAKTGKFVLVRKWSPDLSSRVYLSGEGVASIFDSIKNEEKDLSLGTIAGAEKIIRQFLEKTREAQKLEEDIISLKKETEAINSSLVILGKQLKRARDSANREITRHKIEASEKDISQKTDKLKDTESRLSGVKISIAESSFLREKAENCIDLCNSLNKAITDLESESEELKSIEESLPFLREGREKKAGEAKLYEARKKYIEQSHNYEILKEKAGICVRVLKKLIDNAEPAQAEEEAETEYRHYEAMLSHEEAGDLFFKHIPPFEFFEDFSSLLPNRIDLEDIFENNSRIEGYKAVRNFLIVAGLDPAFFRQSNNRILKQKIENLNNEVTVDFQEYWRQNLGKTNKIRIHFELEHYDITHPEKMGRPYLEFWIKDQHERLYPKQRSRGVRWFLSFYLELKAFARENHNRRRVLLIDEPGLSLHARAQEDVLKVFEDIKGKIQIIYTTHSPHLVDTSRLYRLLAVQRSNDNNEHSETIIFDASHLHSATSDTLSPVCTLLGGGPIRQEILNRKKNVIVEDVSTYYYFSGFSKILELPSEYSFIPANGPAGVTTLVNLLMGWGFNFTVILFDNNENSDIIAELQSYLHSFEKNDQRSKLLFAGKIQGAEDIFSTLDFKKHIIKKRVGISGTNTGYIVNQNISRPLLAASFAQAAASGQVTVEDIDEETRENLNRLFSSLREKITTLDETL